MKILVLGGSRFLGKTFVDTALEANHVVTVFNRGTQNEELNGVEILVGDRNGDLSALKGRQWDAVLDTCGFAPHIVRKSVELLKDQVDQYTYISSISVYPDWIEENITEDYHVRTMAIDEADRISQGSADRIPEFYGEFKTLCELEAEQKMPGRVLNVRAGLLVGPGDYTDRLTYWVNRVAKGGKVLAPGNPKRRVQFIDNKDLSRWILKMMEKRDGGTFNVTGPDYPLTMEEFLLACKKVTGSDAEFVWASEEFLKENQVAPWMELPLWIPETFALEGQSEPWKGSGSINIDKAVDKGLSFRPVEETVKDIYEWDQARNLPANEWKAGISAERERELLSKLSADAVI